jgi:hypothetical protein
MRTWQRHGVWWIVLALVGLPVVSAAHLWGVDGSHGTGSHARCDHAPNHLPAPADQPGDPDDCQFCKVIRAASVGAPDVPASALVVVPSQPRETLRATTSPSRPSDAHIRQRAPPPSA